MRGAAARWPALLVTLCALLVPAAAQGAGRCGEHLWCDRSLSPEQRAELLLGALSADEKYGLMGGDDGSGFTVPDRNSGRSDGVARLDVPPLTFQDGPAGIRQGFGANQRAATALPAPLGLAASFDPALARRAGALVGREARARGADVLLGPTVNIARVPQAGRTFEGYGEDPFLTGRLAVGWIRGLQSTGVIANVKHYAANSQETNRLTIDSVIDERTLREIYLPHFEAAVREGRSGTVMSAYNRVNGPFSGASRELLTDVLRRDFGFRGFVLSDFFAGGDTVGSANGGQSLELPATSYFAPDRLRAAVAAGQISPATIDGLVGDVLRVMFRFGVFDRAAFPADGPIDVAAHAREARRLAERQLVLLKNDRRLLPLDTRRLRTLAVVGPAADTYRAGGGSSFVKPFASVTVLEGLRRRARGVRVRHDDGQDVARAAAVARRADAAVVAVSVESGEFADRPCLALDCAPATGTQDALVRAVLAANPRTVVLLQSPGPVLMPWADDARAIVEAFYPGQQGGHAIASVLFGDANPSARLPVSYPRQAQDRPAAAPEQFPGVGGRSLFSEGVLVGYRHYDARRLSPRFPFGHGLSYSSFRHRDVRIRPAGSGARVSLSVQNSGRRDGAEVVQLYLGLPQPRAGVTQPPKALKAFGRVALRAGERRRVTLELPERAFSYWDVRRNRWTVARGCYRVMVGASSRDIRLRGVIARGGAVCGG